MNYARAIFKSNPDGTVTAQLVDAHGIITEKRFATEWEASALAIKVPRMEWKR